MTSAIRILLYPFRFLWYKAGLRTWWLNDHWLLGKLVELNGNKVSVDGLKFYLDNPAIQTSTKCRFILNRYENEEREAINAYLNPHLPVIELGACVGVVSCLTNKKLSDVTRHVVVEANTLLVHTLEKNRSLNRCSFKIENVALGYTGEVEFYLHNKFVGGSVQRETGRSIHIPAVSLQSLIHKNNFEKITHICDIEGAEIELIDKELTILADHVSTFMVEFHPQISTKGTVENSKRKLEGVGFKSVYDQKNIYVYENLNLKN